MANKDFSNKLQALRKKRGLTQQQVADVLGINKVTYSSYEISKCEPSVFRFFELMKLYGVRNTLEIFEIDFTGEYDSIDFNADEVKFINLYRSLDAEDRAELRGEVKQMLKNDKYSIKSKLNA